MALPITNSFEGGSDETTISNANSGGTSGTAFDNISVTPKFDTARAAHGSVSCRIDIVSDTPNVEWRSTATGGDWTTVYGRCYIYFTANPSATVRLIGIFNSGGSRMADVSVQSSGVLRVSDTAFTSDDTVGTILLNQWTRIEFKVIHSATVGQIEAKIFSADSVSPITNGTVTSAASRNTGTAAQRASFGQAVSNAQTTTFWIDSLQLNSTAYPGPLVTNQVILPDADLATTGWSTAPLFRKINDSSDATVITATAS